MGNLTNSCCPKDLQTQKLLNTFEVAMKSTQKGVYVEEKQLQNYRHILENLIKDAVPAKETFGSIQAELISKLDCSSTKQISKEKINPGMKIILRVGVDENSHFSSTNESQQINNGYIIYSNAYYYGDINRGTAHGAGTLHFPETLFEVEGIWEQDSLKKGRIFQIKYEKDKADRVESCELQLINGVKRAKIICKDFEYQGSITLEGATNLNQILTGEGVITYQNGDVYNGRLVNGLYETFGGKTATIIYSNNGEIKSYSGCFKSGYREDRGILQILPEEGHPFRINMTFSKGIPVGSGEITIDDSSYAFDVQDSKLIVKDSL